MYQVRIHPSLAAPREFKQSPFLFLTRYSNGRTGGIASPSAEAQAAAIRRAYANAGISNLNETAYLECHGTGTQAGDPIEVRGIASVFSETRADKKPLLIGSVSLTGILNFSREISWLRYVHV